MVIAAADGGTVSLVLGIASVIAALIAIALAVSQTRQLRKQIARLEDTEVALKTTQKSIGSLSTEMYEVLELSKAARSTPNLFEGLAALAENCAEIYPQRSTFLSSFVAARLDELVSHSTQARAGTVELSPSDIANMALTLVQLAVEGDAIYTTSYVNTDDFWTRPSAKRYLEKNEELITDRNVEINRIFLFDTPEAAEKDRHEMDKQCRAGIKVRTALTEDLEPDLKRDMFLLGERLAAEYLMTTDRRDILSLRIWDASHKEVLEIRDRMVRLVKSSDEYHPAQEAAVSDVAGASLTDGHGAHANSASGGGRSTGT